MQPGSPESSGVLVPEAWPVGPSPVSSPLDVPFYENDPSPVSPPVAKRRRTKVLVAILLVVVVVFGAVIYLVTRPDNTTTSATPATIALAKSINVRLTDLPAGWIQTTAAAPVPYPAAPSVRLKAERTLAACVGQPLTTVEGWLGAAAFPGGVVTATSPSFQSGSAPTVQIFSTTTVMGSSGQAEALTAFFDAPAFGRCYGQYQAAAVAAPATAQVQAVPLSAPAGVKAHGYLTVFTLAGQSTEVVGQAFIVGGRTVTVLQPSTAGPIIPSSDFGPAFTAVAGRVARAAG
jgi:hypothetical protein